MFYFRFILIISQKKSAETAQNLSFSALLCFFIKKLLGNSNIINRRNNAVIKAELEYHFSACVGVAKLLVGAYGRLSVCLYYGFLSRGVAYIL